MWMNEAKIVDSIFWTFANYQDVTIKMLKRNIYTLNMIKMYNPWGKDVANVHEVPSIVTNHSD